MAFCYLHGFRNIVPKNRREQSETLEWLASAHAQAEVQKNPTLTDSEKETLAERTGKFVKRVSRVTERIRFRASMLDDFTHRQWEKMRVYDLTQSPSGVATRERSRFYAQQVEEVFREFYPPSATPPGAILHVTCTGYVSPSGAQRLVAERDWGRSTEVLHAYHMGCYAALPSIRMAAGLLAVNKKSVDLVHTELCSLHLNPAHRPPEQLIIQALFSDGLIRYSAACALPDGESGFEVCAVREEIIPGTASDMTWTISNHGIEMTLSREVPDRIGGILDGFLERLLFESGITPDELKQKGIFAIHPGGPAIIDQVQEKLKLRSDQVAASNHILENYGNMSSATLPHIWKSILEDTSVVDGTWIVSMAFGPGLTVSGMLLRKNV